MKKINEIPKIQLTRFVQRLTGDIKIDVYSNCVVIENDDKGFLDGITPIGEVLYTTTLYNIIDDLTIKI